MFIPPFALHRAQLFLTLLLVVVSCAGCAASERHALTSGEVRGALGLRADGPHAEIEAEQLAGLDVLALPRPSSLECANARAGGFWRACALAWNPGVRAARRELQVSKAKTGLAGRPEAIEASLETLEFADTERESKVGATIDLLGLFGLGPKSIERESARGEVQRARSALESAVWSAMFDVERARVHLAASRERQDKLNGLLQQVAAQSERFEILERRGRLSKADALMAKAAPHEIEHALSEERGRDAELHAELARVSGMPFEHASFASVFADALNEDRGVAPSMDARELLEQDPLLRELRVEYAQAELHVRRVAADAWPTLRAGPQFTFVPSDLLLGGILDLSLPWPGRVEKEVRIASAEREAARERVEDAFNVALARVASLTLVEHEARMRAIEHGKRLDDAQESAWQATNARLRLGLASAMEWSRALRERIGPLVGLVNEREEAAIAVFDLAQASGVVPQSKVVQP